MIYKKLKALVCITLIAASTLSVVNERGLFVITPVMAQSVDARKAEADQLLEKGIQEYKTSQFREALQSLQKALPIYREVGNRSGEATTLNNLGLVYSDIGQPQEALKYYQQALPIRREVGNRSGEATTLNNLGAVYSNIGQPQEALKYYQQALPIRREVGNRSGEATTLNNLGGVYSDLGQPQEALEYYQQALPILREVGDRSGEAATLNNLGLVYSDLGQPQEALKYYQQALPISREVGNRSGEAATLNNLGLVYSNIGQPQEAIQMLEASQKIILAMRGGLSRENRKAFLTANENTVISLANLLIKQKQPEKAFEWLNLSTTADLADYNRLIDAKVANPETQQAIDNWKANNQELEEMRQKLSEKFSTEAARQVREFEAKVYKQAENIAQKYPEASELFETKPGDITQLRNNINPGTVVIQPVLLKDKIAIFLLTKEQLKVIQTDIAAAEFNQLVSDYGNQLSDYQNTDVYVTGSKLYDILIRPIEAEIKTNNPNNLAIIATGKLRYISFETLYDSQTKQYLLQKYPISYLTRISSYRPPVEGVKTNQANLKVLSIANPKPTKQELKGTEIETENISKIFPGSENYLGEKATIDIFKTQASRFSILHLGTHGCFDPNGCLKLSMEPNTILFANNQQYNIADAALLGLKNTELITLSACQTAKEANGQEISGLAYVLERAGAKSVIASLWNVEDKTSGEIMTQFYQNLQKGMSKSTAMQQAKLTQIKQHPFFWSPFILIGDAQ